MNLWDAFTCASRRIGFIGISRRIRETLYTNMKNKELLSASQDSVWGSGLYLPKETDGGETTYCNLATTAVLRAMGCTELDGLTADDMYACVKASKNWLIKPMADAQFLVNCGSVLIAILPSSRLGQSHGHVCTLTPGQPDYSGHWDKHTPLCMNLGRKGTCFRSRGINWAFVPEPEIIMPAEASNFAKTEKCLMKIGFAEFSDIMVIYAFEREGFCKRQESIRE